MHTKLNAHLLRNSYYGWYIAAALALTETVSWGVLYYAFSVFITPMEAELGWTRGEVTGAFSVMLLVTAVMAFPVGAWVDKYGARALMTAGSIGATVLIIAWSQVTNLIAFYVIWAGLGVCAAAVLYEPAFAVIATWFTHQRSTALAIVTFAGGLASTIFVPLSDLLLNTFEWRNAVLILGGILGLTTILPHALVLRHRPEDISYLPDGNTGQDLHQPPAHASLSVSDALQSRFFWMLTVAFSLSYLAGTTIRVHFIPFLIESNVDPSSAALASGAIGIMQVVGRVIFAPLDMRLSGQVIIIGIFAMQAAATGILLLSSSTAAIGLFIVVFGTAYGARTLARPSILADLFGIAHYGRISGVMQIFLTIAATVAPVSAGLMYDRFGNYQAVLWVVLLLGVSAVAVTIIAQPDAQR